MCADMLCLSFCHFEISHYWSLFSAPLSTMYLGSTFLQPSEGTEIASLNIWFQSTQKTVHYCCIIAKSVMEELSHILNLSIKLMLFIWCFLLLLQELSKIAMPVVFNEPLSFLQRISEYMEHTHLIHKACSLSDSIDRMQVRKTN